MLKRRSLGALASLCLGLTFVSCGNPGVVTGEEDLRRWGDSKVISAEADWARRIASLRADDAGTNNGRTRIAVLEILYALREELEIHGDTSRLRQDLDVVQAAVERMYSSANPGARGEWQRVSIEFMELQTQLDNPRDTRRALNQLITSLGG
jgi:chromosome segregation ATPase